VGYAHVDGVLSHWAAWVGVYGISALAIAASLWLAALLRSSAPYPPQSTEGADKRPSMLLSSEGKPGLIIALAILVITSSLLQHNWVNPSGPSFRSLLMQTNVSQLQKFDAQRLLEQHERIVHMILRAQVDLTVSPETAWISPWAHSPLESREKLVQALAKQGGVLALGMPLGKDIENGETLPIRSNSLVLMQGQGQWLGRYDKQHLVPFGEFVPPGFRWFVEQMRIPLGDFERGKDPAPIHTVAGRLIGFNICYEDLFPEAIAWQVQQGAHVLVNASNLAWFGDSHALHQHLQISRMRSLELQRPMLRATNTGATAAIGADGRVVAKLPHLSEEVLVTNVQPMKGLTPFARYRLGSTWVFLGLMLIVALCLARFKALTNRGIKISS
jgi:apolipoprotein N-acyltransferase